MEAEITAEMVWLLQGSFFFPDIMPAFISQVIFPMLLSSFWSSCRLQKIIRFRKEKKPSFHMMRFLLTRFSESDYPDRWIYILWRSSKW